MVSQFAKGGPTAATAVMPDVQASHDLRNVPIDRVGSEKSVQMTIAPCTQYYLVAVKATQLARDYEVRVDHQEPVPGCKPPARTG